MHVPTSISMHKLKLGASRLGLLRHCCHIHYLNAAVTHQRPSGAISAHSRKAQVSSYTTDDVPFSGEDSASGGNGSSPTKGGGSHDDFWASVKSSAEKTAAYQSASSGDRTNPTEPFPPDRHKRGFAGHPASAKEENQLLTSSGFFVPLFDMNDPTHLSPVRRVVVRKYKDVVLVDIRQYYKDHTGYVRPGQKGISLTVPQYAKLKASLGIIDELIRKEGGDPNDTNVEHDAPQQ